LGLYLQIALINKKNNLDLNERRYDLEFSQLLLNDINNQHALDINLVLLDKKVVEWISEYERVRECVKLKMIEKKYNKNTKALP